MTETRSKVSVKFLETTICFCRVLRLEEDVLLLCEDPLSSSVFRFMNDAIGPDRLNLRRAVRRIRHNNVVLWTTTPILYKTECRSLYSCG